MKRKLSPPHPPPPKKKPEKRGDLSSGGGGGGGSFISEFHCTEKDISCCCDWYFLCNFSYYSLVSNCHRDLLDLSLVNFCQLPKEVACKQRFQSQAKRGSFVHVVTGTDKSDERLMLSTCIALVSAFKSFISLIYL